MGSTKAEEKRICDGCRELHVIRETTEEGQDLCADCSELYHSTDPWWCDTCEQEGHYWIVDDDAPDWMVCARCGIYDDQRA